MRKTAIDVKTAPWPGGAYSQGIRWGNLVFTAGMGPHDPETGKVVGDTIEEQTAQVMKNLAAVLAVHGLTFDHVLKTTVHLTDLPGDFRRFDRTYREFVNPPYPARTTVGSKIKGDILVEIDMVAAVPDETAPESGDAGPCHG
jgi:2-iminobutanoate/2-iminopropanoate deaminase